LRLERGVEIMGELNNREEELVALGAAIASNCAPCIEYHIPAARSAGLGDSQIEEAIRIADKVRRVPARMVLQTALARIAGEQKGADKAPDAGCGCEGSSQTIDSGCDG
jgi:AhpD family alkylhydroperoxidase